MLMEHVYPLAINVENGTAQMDIVLHVTMDISLITVTVLLPVLPSQEKSQLILIAILGEKMDVKPALIEHILMLMESASLLLISVILGIKLTDYVSAALMDMI